MRLDKHIDRSWKRTSQDNFFILIHLHFSLLTCLPFFHPLCLSLHFSFIWMSASLFPLFAFLFLFLAVCFSYFFFLLTPYVCVRLPASTLVSTSVILLLPSSWSSFHDWQAVSLLHPQIHSLHSTLTHAPLFCTWIILHDITISVSSSPPVQFRCKVLPWSALPPHTFRCTPFCQVLLLFSCTLNFRNSRTFAGVLI